VKLLDAIDVRGLLGLLLADGSLVSYRTPGGGYVQLTLTAGPSESAFLDEKVAEFRQFIPTKAKIVPYKTAPRANGQTTPILRFRVSTNKLRPIHNLLYPRGERQITKAALDLLGGEAAAWMWAEGMRMLESGTVSLARVGNTEEEARLVSRWLETLTGASSSLNHYYIRPRLVFEKEQADKIKSTLYPYAPNSRKHLFTGEEWNASSIRSARTELQLGNREDRSQRDQEKTLARNI